MTENPEDDIAVLNIERRYKNMLKFFGTIFQTLTPGSYYHLARQPAKRGWHYFYQIMTFSFILMLLVGLPILFQLPQKLQEETLKLDNITIVPTVEVNKLISLDRGRIKITNEKEYGNEILLITKDEVYVKKTICLLSKLSCIFVDEPAVRFDAERARQLLDNKKELSTIFLILFLIMLPGLLLLLYLFLFIKYMLIIVVAAFFAFILCLFLKNRMRWKEILLTSIYASTLMIIPDVGFSMYFNLYYIPFAVYLFMVLVCVLILGEKHRHA